MGIKIKARITKELFHRDDYYILACTPLESNREVKLNQYGGFTIVGNLGFLTVDNEYELEVIEGKATKYGINYEVCSVPSLSKKDLGQLTDEEKFSIMKVATTSDRLAHTVLEQYPNFIEDVVTKSDEELDKIIDLKKLKGIGTVYYNCYKRILREKYKYIFFIQSKEVKPYDLSLDDAKMLFKKWSDTNQIINELKQNPYFVLTNICEKSFNKVDTLLKSIRPDLIDSDERCEAVVMDILSRNQYDGNTRLNGNTCFHIMKDEYNCEHLKSRLVRVCKESSNIYYDEASKDLSLFVTYMKEVNIASFVKANIQNDPLDFDVEQYRTLDNSIVLTDEQLKAVENFKNYKISLLQGSAGCGKSTSAQAIVNVCRDLGLSTTLLTPTGASALRLSETTGRTASTIHLKCLRDKEINTDCLLVDECSMIDTDLFHMMISCINNSKMRVVLIADANQLIPVGYGTPFADLLMSNIVPTTLLDKVFRYGNSGIAFAGANTRQGRNFFDDAEVKNVNGRLNIMGDWDFYECDNDEEITKKVVDLYGKMRNNHIKKDDILILSAYNIGECGVNIINQLIQEAWNPPKKDEKIFERKVPKFGKIVFRVGDRVINTKNNYSALPYESWLQIEESNGLLSSDDVETTVIYNGQRGDVVDVQDKVMVVKFDEQLIAFDKLEVYNLLLAYAISCHKSQGSECGHVISVVSPNQSKLMTRNLMYVANTRAKKYHINVGSVKAYKDALRVDGVQQRNTWLLDLLTEKDYEQAKS